MRNRRPVVFLICAHKEASNSYTAEKTSTGLLPFHKGGCETERDITEDANADNFFSRPDHGAGLAT
jgi:hypothetical protein